MNQRGRDGLGAALRNVRHGVSMSARWDGTAPVRVAAFVASALVPMGVFFRQAPTAAWQSGPPSWWSSFSAWTTIARGAAIIAIVCVGAGIALGRFVADRALSKWYAAASGVAFGFGFAAETTLRVTLLRATGWSPHTPSGSFGPLLALCVVNTCVALAMVDRHYTAERRRAHDDAERNPEAPAENGSSEGERSESGDESIVSEDAASSTNRTARWFRNVSAGCRRSFDCDDTLGLRALIITMMVLAAVACIGYMVGEAGRTGSRPPTWWFSPTVWSRALVAMGLVGFLSWRHASWREAQMRAGDVTVARMVVLVATLTLVAGISVFGTIVFPVVGLTANDFRTLLVMLMTVWSVASAMTKFSVDKRNDERLLASRMGWSSGPAVGDVYWGDVTYSNQLGSKERPVIVTAFVNGKYRVFYTTSQEEKRATDSRYARLASVDSGGKHSYLNTKEPRVLTRSELRRRHGAILSSADWTTVAQAERAFSGVAPLRGIRATAGVT